jgi:hypothetical protein
MIGDFPDVIAACTLCGGGTAFAQLFVGHPVCHEASHSMNPLFSGG